MTLGEGSPRAATGVKMGSSEKVGTRAGSASKRGSMTAALDSSKAVRFFAQGQEGGCLLRSGDWLCCWAFFAQQLGRAGAALLPRSVWMVQQQTGLATERAKITARSLPATVTAVR